jgi:hypothetical protein
MGAWHNGKRVALPAGMGERLAAYGLTEAPQ